MSDAIKHECGIAMIRLRKPYQYYIDKYQTPLYGVNRLYLLMQKQHNRGQDGAGVAVIKMDVPPGHRYISRYRSIEDQPLTDIFDKIGKKFRKAKKLSPEHYMDGDWLKRNVAFSGEVLLGHLRYGTHGQNSVESCHPMLRMSNWRSRNLAVAGNFNMTNVDELFDLLVELGQHPKEKRDTVTVMEKIGHFLDEENQVLFNKFKPDHDNQTISHLLEDNIDLGKVLRRSCKDFDGGYAMAGMTGYGGAFVARDPAGIRPAYYYADDEVIVVASEKPAIKTAFGVDYSEIREIAPGNALIIDKKGDYHFSQFTEPLEKKSCSFERIYFSRGSDPDIYGERRALGRLMQRQVLEAIDNDIENSVFSYIPNTAETAFLGMMTGLEKYLINHRKKTIEEGTVTGDALEKVLSFRPRVEKLVIKDAKLRTFIADDSHRDELVAHVYDTTYEVIRKNLDTVVVIDDSIVRGTTLEKSIIRMLDRLEPKKIVIVSSAPQIRYPDCYGIDMSRLKDFVAFRAALALLEERDMMHILDEVYDRCKASLTQPKAEVANHVKAVYAPFTDEDISKKIAQIIRHRTVQAEVTVVYQTVENLHQACPNHKGDWYFTGDFPTPGGNRVVNKAFMFFMEGITQRAY